MPNEARTIRARRRICAAMRPPRKANDSSSLVTIKQTGRKDQIAESKSSACAADLASSRSVPILNANWRGWIAGIQGAVGEIGGVTDAGFRLSVTGRVSVT